MYSASIIRKGFTYRLELESINTSSINISSSGIIIKYEQQNNDQRYQPSMRGSLRVTIISDDKLIDVEGVSLFKDDVLIFKGLLNDLDDKEYLDNPAKYQTDLEFGDYMTSFFDAYSIAGEEFLSSSNSNLRQTSHYNIKEIYQDSINDSISPIVKSSLQIQVELDDETGVNTYLWKDQPTNLYFDHKPFLENDLTVLECLEDCMTSTLSKSILIGEQLHIIQENNAGYLNSEVINITDDDSSIDSYKYETLEPSYDRYSILKDDTKQNKSLNTDLLTNNEEGRDGYIGFDLSNPDALYQCYQLAGKYITNDLARISNFFAHRKNILTSVLNDTIIFNYDIEFDLIYLNSGIIEKSFEIWLIVGYVDNNGNHYYQDSTNNWVSLGQPTIIDGGIQELEELYDETYFTFKSSVNNEGSLLKYSGDTPSSLLSNLNSTINSNPNGTNKGGCFYLFTNRIIESGTKELDYYTINNYTFNDSFEGFSPNFFLFETNPFIKRFNVTVESGKEDVETYTNNNIQGFGNGAWGCIGAKENENSLNSIKIFPDYWADQSTFLGIGVRFDINNSNTFTKSLEDSIKDYQNNYTGNNNRVIEIVLEKHYYISPLTKVVYNGSDYFITEVTCDIEEGNVKIKMINFNE